MVAGDLDFDVVVVGGGPAGVSAAISAGRLNLKVALLEARPFVGGNPGFGVILEGYISRYGKQVVYGIGHEYVERLIKRRGAVGHIYVGTHFHSVTPVDPDKYRILIMEMLTEAGVDVFYQVPLVGVETEGSRIVAAKVAVKGGIGTIRGKVFIDASGDGDLSALAGAKFRLGTGEPEQDRPVDMMPVSMILQCRGTDNYRIADAVNPNGPKALFKSPEYEDALPVHFGGNFSKWNDYCRDHKVFPHDDQRATFNGIYPDECYVNTSFMARIDGTDSLAVSRATAALTAQVARIGDFFRECVPGMEKARFVPTTVVGVRETRHIMGEYETSDDDALNGRKHADTIGQCAFPMDVHHPETNRATFTQIGGDGAFDIRYGAIVVAGLENVFVAGRCASSAPLAFGAFRGSGPAIIMGEAAGAAASICIRENVAAAQIEVPRLQSILRSKNVYLGEAAS
jgi:hypothetical protein